EPGYRWDTVWRPAQTAGWGTVSSPAPRGTQLGKESSAGGGVVALAVDVHGRPLATCRVGGSGGVGQQIVAAAETDAARGAVECQRGYARAVRRQADRKHRAAIALTSPEAVGQQVAAADEAEFAECQHGHYRAVRRQVGEAGRSVHR